MKYFIRISLLLFFFAFNQALVLGQSNESACACCTEAYKYFDFWEGKWEVTDTLGNVVGINTLTKLEDNCIMQEQWVGTSGSTGTSLNYYDKTDKSWNQIWIDNQGNVLKMKGGMNGVQMILKSELVAGQQGKYYNQISWTPNDDGTVTQLWEAYDADENLLQTLFRGIYHKTKEE